MKQLTRSKYENFEKTVKFLALNYFLKKVLSSSGMVLNALLGYYDSICYYNTDGNTVFPSSETKKSTAMVEVSNFPLVHD